MRAIHAAALVTLLPAMFGPGPAAMARDGTLVLALCGGGTVAVSMAGGSSPAPAAPPPTACCAKGCHNPERRRLVDPRQ